MRTRNFLRIFNILHFIEIPKAPKYKYEFDCRLTRNHHQIQENSGQQYLYEYRFQSIIRLQWQQRTNQKINKWNIAEYRRQTQFNSNSNTNFLNIAHIRRWSKINNLVMKIIADKFAMRIALRRTEEYINKQSASAFYRHKLNLNSKYRFSRLNSNNKCNGMIVLNRYGVRSSQHPDKID